MRQYTAGVVFTVQDGTSIRTIGHWVGAVSAYDIHEVGKSVYVLAAVDYEELENFEMRQLYVGPETATSHRDAMARVDAYEFKHRATPTASKH